jgi:hypothetical protein
MIASGCAAQADDEPPPPYRAITKTVEGDAIEHEGMDDGPSHFDSVAHEPCSEGDVEECSIYLKLGNGSTACFQGQQACVEGEWEDCRRPEFEEPDFVPDEEL